MFFWVSCKFQTKPQFTKSPKNGWLAHIWSKMVSSDITCICNHMHIWQYLRQTFGSSWFIIPFSICRISFAQSRERLEEGCASRFVGGFWRSVGYMSHQVYKGRCALWETNLSMVKMDKTCPLILLMMLCQRVIASHSYVYRKSKIIVWVDSQKSGWLNKLKFYSRI